MVRPAHPRTARSALPAWAGAAAALGGAFWMAKGLVILATGDEPEYLFLAAPLLFALGLAGLHSLLRGRESRAARLGGWTAWAAVGFAAPTAVIYAATTDDELLPLPVTIPAASLLLVVSLLLLGTAARRESALSGRRSSAALLLGIAYLPLLAIGGILESVDERLLEIPVVLLGAGWVALGWALARQALARSGSPGLASPPPRARSAR